MCGITLDQLRYVCGVCPVATPERDDAGATAEQSGTLVFDQGACAEAFRASIAALLVAEANPVAKGEPR